MHQKWKKKSQAKDVTEKGDLKWRQDLRDEANQSVHD
jgi:hypothetical protein